MIKYDALPFTSSLAYLLNLWILCLVTVLGPNLFMVSFVVMDAVQDFTVMVNNGFTNWDLF